MYSHTWEGNVKGCDCLGVCGYYMSGCNQFHLDVYCTYNQTRYGCREFRSHPPVIMSTINEKMICGTEGGIPFLNATRPDMDNKCPDGFAPCSDKSEARDTICYDTAK